MLSIRFIAVISLLTIISFTTGCRTTTVKQHNLPCHHRTQSDVIRSATSILVQNGFRITLSDTLVGLVQAETEEMHDIWTGVNSKRVWQISIKHSLDSSAIISAGNAQELAASPDIQPLYIVAFAKVVGRTQNAFGATLASGEMYYDSETHKDWEWYWDVRKGLEGICGAVSVITSKKMN
ncbi:MAG: hypothetical protein HYX66_06055 [Ignavibacteria bacterium]|nr:hypothetical protein [Ignavibacteria bacterium]